VLIGILFVQRKSVWKQQRHQDFDRCCFNADQLVSPAAGGLEDYAENATVGLLNYHTIKNGLYLGHTEFRDLAGPVDWQQLEDLGVTTAFLNICIHPEEDVTKGSLLMLGLFECMCMLVPR